MKGEPEETLTSPPPLNFTPPGLSLAPPTSSATPATPASTRTGLPIREDCWSEEASCTLVEAWGERYLELNRGNLRQQHWQLVADTVNNRHANNNNHSHNKKFLRRSDVQCKNRIDTLKKKYKLEKARVLSSNGTYKSNWPLYDQLDALIGNTVQPKKMMSVSPQSQPSPMGLPYYQQHRKTPQQLPAMFVHPVTLRDKQKRSPPPPAGYVPPAVSRGIDESFFRRNYSAVAAAAAAVDDVGGDSDSSRSSGESDRGGQVDGFGELAKAISAFADIYEKVEGARQRQMMELEKERMEFMKSLEYQRMQLFMDSQVQMEKIKRTKRDAAATASDA
ncbi:trihelix transcription factor ASIL2-like [Papaver somniferum]|uniref:trihelix transcription factor ASIL2-like n=1 Tax=Papaver somniferum TaxID=3469 RepID=UPI000E6F57F8|nr:trihelix transcription factor ASIL2-like [Papaver somniferum]